MKLISYYGVNNDIKVVKDITLGIFKKITSQYSSLFCAMPRRQNPWIATTIGGTYLLA
jgi:hypothetical protein